MLTGFWVEESTIETSLFNHRETLIRYEMPYHSSYQDAGNFQPNIKMRRVSERCLFSFLGRKGNTEMFSLSSNIYPIELPLHFPHPCLPKVINDL